MLLTGNGLPRPEGRRKRFPAGLIEYPLNWLERKDIDRKPLFDLVPEQGIQHEIEDVVNVFDIHDSPEIDALWIFPARYFKNS